MSVQTIGWVLEDCPDLPKHLVATMIGLANHADRDGKGAYPSQETLAWYTRKDERSVRRDLDQLEELKLIRKGDQRMVLHLPPDKRPIVWDLAVERKRAPRPEPGRPGRPRKEKETEGTSASTGNSGGDVDVKNGGTPAPKRGDVDVKNGGTPAPKPQDADVPRTVLEPSVEPSIEPSVPSERPDGIEKAASPVQSALIGDDTCLDKKEPTNRDKSMGIARGWVGKWAEAGIPMIMRGQKSDPMHAVAALLLPCLDGGYSEIEVKYALMYVNEPFPAPAPLNRALMQVRRGWRPGKDWTIGAPSPSQNRAGRGRPVVDVNEAWEDETPQSAAAASAGGRW